MASSDLNDKDEDPTPRYDIANTNAYVAAEFLHFRCFRCCIRFLLFSAVTALVVHVWLSRKPTILCVRLAWHTKQALEVNAPCSNFQEAMRACEEKVIDFTKIVNSGNF